MTYLTTRRKRDPKNPNHKFALIFATPNPGHITQINPPQTQRMDPWDHFQSLPLSNIHATITTP